LKTKRKRSRSFKR